MGRDPEYLRFVRAVASALAAAGTRDLIVDGADGPLRARLLVPPDAGDVALVYVHGGGWYLGDLDGWEPVARVIAQATGCRVLEIEHRQAPEHPFPAPSATA
jgi:acetyl esterase